MAGNGRCFAGRAGFYVNAVIAALAKKLGTVMIKVADQIDPLREIRARGSRMTVLLRKLPLKGLLVAFSLRIKGLDCVRLRHGELPLSSLNFYAV